MLALTHFFLFLLSLDKSSLALTPHTVPHPRAEHLPMPKQVPIMTRGAPQMYPQQQPELFYPEPARPLPSGSQYDPQYPTGEWVCSYGWLSEQIMKSTAPEILGAL